MEIFGQKEKPVNKSKKVIYTALTGDYDNLRQPESVCPDCDYICFSNDIVHQRIGVWEIRRFDYHNSSKVRESRFPKLNPHLLLPEYTYSLYVDCKIVLRASLNDRFVDLAKQDIPLAMIPHPDRDCVYQEAMILTAWNVGEPGLVFHQTKELLKNHFPQNYGLYDNAVMYRKHNMQSIINFSETWWKLYCQYSSRDQMSGVYALFLNDLKPEILFPASFWQDNVAAHKKKRKTIGELSFRENLLRYFAVFRLKCLYWRYHINLSVKN